MKSTFSKNHDRTKTSEIIEVLTNVLNVREVELEYFNKIFSSSFIRILIWKKFYALEFLENAKYADILYS